MPGSATLNSAAALNGLFANRFVIQRKFGGSMYLRNGFLVYLIFYILFYGTLAYGGVRAFPTAEGYGAGSAGGRGGRIIKVTNLNDAGPGSLRAALEATGPRIVIFDVTGTISISSDICVNGPERSYLTVAGQTSPGGIQIKGPDHGITIGYGAHDVIVRHLRVRPGGPAAGEDTGNAITVYSPVITPTYNVIIDHCSLEWGNDDLAIAYSTVHNITFQWNIIAEGTPTGVNGAYGTLMLIGGWPWGKPEMITVTAHHNLFAHGVGRCPYIQRSGVVDFRNNVIYNWSVNNALQAGSRTLNHSGKFNFVNNHYLAGPNSSQGPYLFLSNGGESREAGGTKIYTEGNWGPFCPTGCENDWDNKFVTADKYPPDILPVEESVYRVKAPFPEGEYSVVTDPTDKLKEKVLLSVGAYKPSRDSVDLRIVNDVKNLTGDIKSIGQGGPWPVLTRTSPLTDSDGDAIPDRWEAAHGLNPDDPGDGPEVAPNGYTNIENYLNELAGDPVF